MRAKLRKRSKQALLWLAAALDPEDPAPLPRRVQDQWGEGEESLLHLMCSARPDDLANPQPQG